MNREKIRERLTINAIIEHCDRKTRMYEKACDVKYLETAVMGNGIKEYWEHKQVAEYLRKLKDYEDLEEQGRLLKLPCKIGDDVYFVPSQVNYKLNILNRHSENNKVYHQKVENFVLTRRGWYLECDQDVKYGAGHILTDRFFNETWFLTKSEAEAKLKELRGKNE